MMKVVSAAIVLLFIFSCSGSEDEGVIGPPGFYAPVVNGIQLVLRSGEVVGTLGNPKANSKCIINENSNRHKYYHIGIYPNPAVSEMEIHLNILKPRTIRVYAVRANAGKELQSEMHFGLKTHTGNSNSDIINLHKDSKLLPSGNHQIRLDSLNYKLPNGFYMVYLQDVETYDILNCAALLKTDAKTRNNIFEQIFENR